MKRFALLLGGVASLQLAGCMVGEDDNLSSNNDVSFEEFKAKTYREPAEIGGAWIVNGDQALHNEKELYLFWEQLYQSEGALIVNTVNGVDDKWNDTQKLNLTYCISNGFGANKQ